MWSIGMAIGIIFVSLTPGFKADLMSYLFGSLLAVLRIHQHQTNSSCILWLVYTLGYTPVT